MDLVYPQTKSPNRTEQPASLPFAADEVSQHRLTSIRQQFFLNVAIILTFLPVIEVSIPQYLTEEVDDTFLYAYFSLANGAIHNSCR